MSRRSLTTNKSDLNLWINARNNYMSCRKLPPLQGSSQQQDTNVLQSEKV
ncbi:5287_t:CDS:2 [Dentiscutata erythropus]|uniref:5287_t:CDS:1 n=1 Tax=Dentiscutata erythropus TaxID=1348616 RepID=A0A9N9DAP2_9GLOM|nr:5287_t:CDS:2 [Dentiscutata erythropus]